VTFIEAEILSVPGGLAIPGSPGQASSPKYSVVSAILINSAAGIIPCIFTLARQYILQYR
jgi:hypothetical protein